MQKKYAMTFVVANLTSTAPFTFVQGWFYELCSNKRMPRIQLDLANQLYSRSNFLKQTFLEQVIELVSVCLDTKICLSGVDR